MSKRFNFGSAVLAGIIATIIMTIVMMFFGIDIMEVLGNASGMYGSSIYLVGGLIHIVIGIVYAIIYAWIFEPLFQKLPKFLAGGIFSLLPFIIAILFMGSFLQTLNSVFVSSSKKEQSKVAVSKYKKCRGDISPYEARYSKRNSKSSSPNCSANDFCGCDCSYDSSCCGPDDDEQCSMYGATDCSVGCGTCCSPSCSAQNSSSTSTTPNTLPMWLISLVNHLVYGVFLGIFYRPKEVNSQP